MSLICLKVIDLNSNMADNEPSVLKENPIILSTWICSLLLLAFLLGKSNQFCFSHMGEDLSNLQISIL